MAEILHKLTIKADANKIYQALTDSKALSSWWTKRSRTNGQIGSMADFFIGRDNINLSMKILRLLPNKLVVWHCMNGYEEWLGTQIGFQIERKGKQTELLFVHSGWKRIDMSFPSWNFSWAQSLSSLKAYCEKGRGFPYRD